MCQEMWITPPMDLFFVLLTGGECLEFQSFGGIDCTQAPRFESADSAYPSPAVIFWNFFEVFRTGNNVPVSQATSLSMA